MKAITLVMVQGGVAYPYAPEHVDVRVIDRDAIEAGDGPVFLPRGTGFEELADQAGLIEGVDFDWWRNE